MELYGINMKINYDLYTRILPNAVIDMKLFQEMEDDAGKKIRDSLQEVGHWMVETQDLQVKAALIKLGWTPPKENNMETQEVVRNLQTIKRVLEKLNAEEVDDPEQIVMGIASWPEGIEAVEKAMNMIENPPILRAE